MSPRVLVLFRECFPGGLRHRCGGRYCLRLRRPLRWILFWGWRPALELGKFLLLLIVELLSVSHTNITEVLLRCNKNLPFFSSMPLALSLSWSLSFFFARDWCHLSMVPLFFILRRNALVSLLIVSKEILAKTLI